MSQSSHKVRNILFFFLGFLVLLFVLVLVFLSPIVKYLIEKYDVKYTGREITLDWAYANPLTGYVHLNNLKIHEYKKDSVFFHSAGVSAHFNMQKLFSGAYIIEDLTLDKARLNIIQLDKKRYNFTDIVEKFADKPGEKKKPGKVHFSMINIKVNDSEIHYDEKITPVNYFIKKVFIESSGMRWDSDTIANKVSFEAGIGHGIIKGTFGMNTKTKDYKMAVDIDELDMKIIEQYLKDLTNYGTFRSVMDIDVTASGNFKDGEDVDAKGTMTVHDFHFGKSKNEDFASFEKFSIKVNKMNPRKRLYLIDSISLIEPFLKYERYDGIDNIGTMFGKKGSNVQAAASSEKFNLVIELGNYVKLLAKNFFHSDYKVNKLGIYRANLRYNDCSLNEKFSMGLDPLTIRADSINSNHQRVFFRLNSGIKPYGDLGVTLSVNPKDSSDFKFVYKIENINATVLNPFVISATTYPLDRGSISFNGTTDVQKGAVQSKNHLLVIDPRITKRIRNKGNSWLPLGVILFFTRDNGNAIDYEIPITGSLKDPEFHFGNIIWNIVLNTFIKPPTTLYRSEVKNVENRIEKSLSFDWQMGSAVMMPDCEKFVKNVASFLKDHPDVSIDVQPIDYLEKEIEYLSFFEAKKKYFRESKKIQGLLSEDDSTDVSRMSIKDADFVKYLNAHVTDKRKFSVQEKCIAFLSEGYVNKKWAELKKAREQTFESYLKDGPVLSRVKVKAHKTEIPFTGFSHYKISYNGALPDDLKNAFKTLDKLDNEEPRAKLKDERNKTRKFLDFFRKKK
jgi:hypothetical protein